jgi:hypothetical protein
MSNRRRLTWIRLDLPVLPTVEAARAAIGALAALPGHPRVVLEARGEKGHVSWYLGAEATVARRAATALGHQLAGLRTHPDASPAASTVAGAVRIPGHRRVQLATAATEKAARSVLGALSGARDGEIVRLQVILGPRHRLRLVGNVLAAERVRVTAKYSEHRLSCEVRIGAKAAEPALARTLVANVAASLRSLEAPGLAIRLKRSSLRALNEVRDPIWWPLELGVSELTAILGWPISAAGGSELPGVPSPHPRLLPAAAILPVTGCVLGVSAVDENRKIAVGVDDSLRSLHILGPNGVGKSALMARLALQDAAAGHSVVLIDAKGDTVTDVLARIGDSRQDEVVVIDPTDPAPVGIHVFRGDPDRAADAVYAVFRSLYGDALGPRSGNVLHAALVTLARSGTASLSHLPLLLSTASFRRSIVPPLATRDPLGLGAFWGRFEALSDAERLQVVAPIRNKLDPILTLRPGLRALFGQSSPAFSLSDVFTKRRILLVSLGNAELGPAGSQLLGSILLSLLWFAAGERASVPHDQRYPVFIHVDEMQEVVRLGDLGDALARGRGLGCGFTLAHQALTQLSPSMRDAVMANARNRICFQLSPKDARDIAATTNGALTARDFQELPAFHAYGSLLSGGNRAPWSSIMTESLSAPIRSPDDIRARSRQRYGRPIAEVEGELMAAAGIGGNRANEPFGRTRRPGRRETTL